jgi:DNA-binding NarL/FixJ family response regulator
LDEEYARTSSSHVRTVDRRRRRREYDSMLSDSGIAAVRVLIVDDQPTFHDVVRELIAATPGFEWIGSASCGEDGIEQTERLCPDLVLMDVRMPGIGGIEAARQIASRGLPAVVVLITAGELPTDIPGGTATEIVPKRHLTRKLLKRLWEAHRQPTAIGT